MMGEVPDMRIVYVYMTQYWRSHKLKFQVITKRSGRLGQRYKTEKCIKRRGSVFYFTQQKMI
jgi:hypothetical protein